MLLFISENDASLLPADGSDTTAAQDAADDGKRGKQLLVVKIMKPNKGGLGVKRKSRAKRKFILVTFVLKGGVKLPPRAISASRLARNKIPYVFRFKLFNGAISNTPR